MQAAWKQAGMKGGVQIMAMMGGADVLFLQTLDETSLLLQDHASSKWTELLDLAKKVGLTRESVLGKPPRAMNPLLRI